MTQDTFRPPYKGDKSYFRPNIGQTVRIEFRSEIYKMNKGEEIDSYVANYKGTYAVVFDEIENVEILMYVHKALGEEVLTLAERKPLKGLRIQATRTEDKASGKYTSAQYEHVKIIEDKAKEKLKHIKTEDAVVDKLRDDIKSMIDLIEVDNEAARAKKEEETDFTVGGVMKRLIATYPRYKKVDAMSIVNAVQKEIDERSK